MDKNRNDIILQTVERAPQWLRHDLISRDKNVRSRAEETIAAMIADAIAPDMKADKE